MKVLIARIQLNDGSLLIFRDLTWEQRDWREQVIKEGRSLPDDLGLEGYR